MGLSCLIPYRPVDLGCTLKKSMEENGICHEKHLKTRFEIGLETSLG
jgi:hypothetical protein